MLATLRKYFQVTADTTGLLANDQVLGDTGKGWYKVTAAAAAAADATITINDGKSAVLNLAPIPVRAAAVTFPEIKKNEDYAWIVFYEGNGPTLSIDIADGTNAEIAVWVEYGGAGRSPVFNS